MAFLFSYLPSFNIAQILLNLERNEAIEQGPQRHFQCTSNRKNRIRKKVFVISVALKNWALLNDMNVSKIISQLEIEAYSPNADRDSLSTSILQEIEDLISRKAEASQQGKSSSSIGLLFIFVLGTHYQTASAEPVDINTLRTQYQNALIYRRKRQKSRRVHQSNERF